MSDGPNRLPSDERFIPLVVKGYVFGTLLSAIALHVAVALIAPGDAGTVAALGSGIFLFIIFLFLGVVGLVAFPLLAAASWPFRGMVFDQPLLAFSLAIAVGLALGAVLTASAFQIGPGDFWSGPLVGVLYGSVWFIVVRSWRAQSSAT